MDEGKPENTQKQAAGRWGKGQSGNPGGRPKIAPEVRALAQQHCPDAVRTIVELMASDDERVRLEAAKAILDRGIGKPIAAIEVSGPEGEPLSVQERRKHEAWMRNPETAAALLTLCNAAIESGSEPEAES